METRASTSCSGSAPKPLGQERGRKRSWWVSSGSRLRLSSPRGRRRSSGIDPPLSVQISQIVNKKIDIESTWVYLFKCYVQKWRTEHDCLRLCPSEHRRADLGCAGLTASRRRLCQGVLAEG